MPYPMDLLFIDFGGFYSSGFPSMTGTLTPVSPPLTPADTANSSTAAPTRLTFPAPSSPPAGSSTMLVRDNGSTGDLFRSGVLGPLPPAPGGLTLFTAPTVSVPFSSIAGSSPTMGMTIAIPTWVAVISGILTAGTFIPLAATVTGALAPSSLTVTVSGTLTARVFYFSVTTYTFTLTFTTVPRPSGDATNRSRILAVAATAASMTAPGVLGPIANLVAPAIAGAVAAQLIEPQLNADIAARAASFLGTIGMRLSSTAAICARRVTVAASGITLQIVLSDLLGPAISPIPQPPRNFAVTITPSPEARVQRTYTITIRDAASGAPVPLANVVVHNFSASGGQQPVGPLIADQAGQVTVSINLRPKIMTIITIGEGDSPPREKERVFISPTLIVTLAGFNRLTMFLLKDPKFSVEMEKL